MAQHLPIQAKHQFQLKTAHQIHRTQRFRLARPTRRQAKLLQTAWRYSPSARLLSSPRPHCFLVTAWRSKPCRQAPPSAAHSPVKTIAWRLSAYRQAPYQNSAFLVYDTPSPQIYHLLTPKVHRRTPILSPRIGEFTTNHM